MSGQGRDNFPPVATQVPFDNQGTDFLADNVQDALVESGVSASPGFSFGRSGLVGAGTWLNRPGNVPSNRAGVTIPVSSPVVREVSCSNRNVDTYTIEIYEHEGNLTNVVLLGSFTVTAARGATFTTSLSTTKGKQIATRLSSSTGSVRDLGVDIVIKGGL
jgi:hypothetical protein